MIPTREQQNEFVSKLWKEDKTVREIRNAFVVEFGWHTSQATVHNRIHKLQKAGKLEPRRKGFQHFNERRTQASI